MAIDNLSGPILKMARYFLVNTLPHVGDVRDVYAYARALSERGIVPARSEEKLLRQVVWCMLQIQNDQMEGELHRALSQLAALVLAVIEDDDIYIPEDRQVGGRLELESLAVELLLNFEQTELQIGAAIGARDLSVRSAADVETFAQQIDTTNDEYLDKALKGAALHLKQGESLLAKQTDPERRARHGARFDEACARTTHLLARLLAVPVERDPQVVRINLVRRELKRIEVDALGAERISAQEQIQKAKELLAWTEVDLGEAATDENRARLALELRRSSDSDDGTADDGGWLFAM